MCNCRRRFIVRMYEYYASRWICGGCGHTFTHGTNRWKTGIKKRLRMRQWVKDTWDNVQRYQDVVRRMCDEIEAET